MRTHPNYPERRFTIRALAGKVLAVAAVDNFWKWRAYIGAVPGENHDLEWPAIAQTGTRLDPKVAEALFPDIAKTHTWEP